MKKVSMKKVSMKKVLEPRGQVSYFEYDHVTWEYLQDMM